MPETMLNPRRRGEPLPGIPSDLSLLISANPSAITLADMENVFTKGKNELKNLTINLNAGVIEYYGMGKGSNN